MSGIQMVWWVMWLYHLNTGHPYCSLFRCSVFRWILYCTVLNVGKLHHISPPRVFKGQGLIMLAFIKTFSIVRHWNSNSISQVWRSTTLDQRAPLSLPQSRCRRRRRKRRNSDSTASSSSGFCRQIFLPSVVPEIRNRRPTLDCREPKIGNSTQTR